MARRIVVGADRRGDQVEEAQEAPKQRLKLPGAAIRVFHASTSFESRHILVTALARDRQTGTAYSKGGSVLLKAGGPPLRMEPVQADITLRGGPVRAVNVVDVYGAPTGRRVPAEGNRFTIDGRFQTYYYEVLR